MSQQRRFKQTMDLEDRLAAEAKCLRTAAEELPYGPEREELMRKARRAETGAHVSEWIQSPGLRAPT
jgi:hypothetical protein